MNKKYININENSYEYGWVYEEISSNTDTGKIKVANVPLFSTEEYDPWELKEIPNKKYQEIMEANFEGHTEKECLLKETILDNKDNFIYGGLLEKHYNIYSIYDKEFESNISFSTLEEFKELLKESPEYFTNEIIVSAYYLAIKDVLVTDSVLLDEIEHEVAGRDHAHDVSVLVKLTEEDFINKSTEEQLEYLSNKIKNS